MNKTTLTCFSAFFISALVGLAASPLDFSKGVELILKSDLAANEITTGIPALVRLSESSIPGFMYSDFLNANGGDMMFTDANDNEIPHEVDTWNPNGESLVWVKLPSTAANTVIKMCWGKGGNPSTASTAVWSDYVGVWHLGESGAANISATVADSTANGYNGTTVAGATCVSASGKIGGGWQISDGAYNSKTDGGILFSGTDSVVMGTQFTISAWAWHKDGSKAYYDHLFYRKEAASNNYGWCQELNNGSFVQLNTMGASKTQKALNLPDTRNEWHHIAISYEGTTCHSFCDGGAVAHTQTGITAPNDNTSKVIAIGCSSKGDDCTWKGKFDEVRVRLGAYDENYLSAEYFAMNTSATDIFQFGAVYMQDDSAPALSDFSFIVNGDGTVDVSVTLSENDPVAGSVKVFVGNNEFAMTTSDVSLPAVYTATITIPAGVTYGAMTYGVKCESTGGNEVQTLGLNQFYNGTPVFTAGDDVDELTLSSGSIIISRTDTNGDFVVNYVAGGTAVAGETYVELPGSATIPDGETSVTIDIDPVFSAEVAEDVSVILTLAPGNYFTPAVAPSATVTIVNAEVDPHCQYVSTTGSDSNDGYSPDRPRLTIMSAVQALGAISTTDPCAVFVADGVYPVSGITEITGKIAVFGNTNDVSSVVVTNTAKRRLFLLNNAESGLYHLTLANGGGNTHECGGNVYIDSNGGTVSNCVLTAGHTDNYNGIGGNLYMKAGLVSTCVIKGGYCNTTGGGNKGNGVYMSGGRVENSLIYANEDKTGGTAAGCVAGVYMKGGSLVNCTIAGNIGKTTGGVYLSGTTPTVKNCVIAGNTSSVTGGDAAAYQLDGKATVAQFVNCVLDCSTAPNATCAVGVVADILSDVANGDCSLAAGSPAIDFGANEALLPSIDLAGEVRIRGDAVDSGCYESDPNQLAASFGSDVESGILPVTVTFNATTTGVDPGTLVTYSWDFDGDGTIDAVVNDSLSSDVQHTYETAGSYTVSLTVSAAEKNIIVEKQNLVYAVQRVFYVDLSCETPAFPYDTWNNAATTIQTAVDAAIDECEIIVRGYGEAQKYSSVTVLKDVYLHSEYGVPESAVLRKSARVLHVGSSGALVSGFTITDGWCNGNYGAGVYFDAAGGTVSNCVIRNCYVDNWASSGSACYFAGPGMLTHSIISNCTARAYNSGTKYIVDVGSGRFENNLVTGNYSSGNLINATAGQTDMNAALLVAGSKAVIRNNTFVDNAITNRGLISVKSSTVFENNAFANNTFASSTEDASDASTAVGFNFGESAFMDGMPVLSHCAFDESCLFETAPNETCIVVPLANFFRNYAGKDFRPGSPLVGKGVNYDDMPELDLGGKLRLVGAKIDIGCYEGSQLATIMIIK